jgi:hypothetical protein
VYQNIEEKAAYTWPDQIVDDWKHILRDPCLAKPGKNETNINKFVITFWLQLKKLTSTNWMIYFILAVRLRDLNFLFPYFGKKHHATKDGSKKFYIEKRNSQS